MISMTLSDYMFLCELESIVRKLNHEQIKTLLALMDIMINGTPDQIEYMTKCVELKQRDNLLEFINNWKRSSNFKSLQLE